jgi:hypothetical protein
LPIDVKDVEPNPPPRVEREKDKDPAAANDARQAFEGAKRKAEPKPAPKKKPAGNAGQFDDKPPPRKQNVDLKGGSARAEFGLRSLPRPTLVQIADAQERLASGRLRGPGAAKAMDVMEAGLSDPKAKVVTKRALGGGVNGTFIVTLSNGLKAVWKPSARENMTQLRTQLEEDHQARREAGAYLVDKALGHFAGAAPAVYRTLDGETGALIAYVNGASNAADAGPVDAEYETLAIFDDVVGNTDRHEGNLLKTSDGHRVPIDHGLTFPLANGPQGFHNFLFSDPVTLSKDQTALLKHLVAQRKELATQLAALGIDDRAIAAMYERVKVMISTGKTSDAWRQ